MRQALFAELYSVEIERSCGLWVGHFKNDEKMCLKGGLWRGGYTSANDQTP